MNMIACSICVRDTFVPWIAMSVRTCMQTDTSVSYDYRDLTKGIQVLIEEHRDGILGCANHRPNSKLACTMMYVHRGMQVYTTVCIGPKNPSTHIPESLVGMMPFLPGYTSIQV